MQDRASMIEVHSYVSPVVVAIPHNGLYHEEFTQYQKRSGHVLADLYTWDLAEALNKDGSKVILVRGLVSRRYLDYNREPQDPKGEDATLDPSLLRAYYAYHLAVATALRESALNFGQALLVDLHGFVNQPTFGKYDIILGTRHRSTVQTNVDIKLGEFLEERGYHTYIPSEEPREGEVLPGRFTVQHHGGISVDAVQLEVHQRHRVNPELRMQLALCLREFLTSPI